MHSGLTKEQALKIMMDAREQALNSKDPHSFLYSTLLSIIQDTLNLTDEEIGPFYGLHLEQAKMIIGNNKGGTK